jgi:Zn-dependent oligopeptidase
MLNAGNLAWCDWRRRQRTETLSHGTMRADSTVLQRNELPCRFLPPLYSLMASARASIDSMSRLLVGSSWNNVITTIEELHASINISSNTVNLLDVGQFSSEMGQILFAAERILSKTRQHQEGRRLTRLFRQNLTLSSDLHYHIQTQLRLQLQIEFLHSF